MHFFTPVLLKTHINGNKLFRLNPNPREEDDILFFKGKTPLNGHLKPFSLNFTAVLTRFKSR
jgi:hypothetical protein